MDMDAEVDTSNTIKLLTNCLSQSTGGTMYRNRIRDYAHAIQNPAATDALAGFVMLPIPPALMSQQIAVWQQMYQAAFELARAAVQPQSFRRVRKAK